MNSVYFVTTIRVINDVSPLNVRTWGWFSTKEKAFEILDKNKGDLIEAGWYHYAVVEEYDEGLYKETMFHDKRWFWKAEGFTAENEHWVKLDKPPKCIKNDSVTSYCEIG